MTGSVASMGLALAVGRGDTQLAKLAGPVPLVRGEDVALIGGATRASRTAMRRSRSRAFATCRGQ